MRSLYFLLLFVTALIAEELSISQIQQAIQEKNAGWVAEENHITRMSTKDRNQMLGAKLVPDYFDASQVLTLPQTEDLPEKFDWRDRDGNWVTPVRDQASCGSCWAFSAIAQVESWWMLQNNDATMNIDLSEQFCVSCTDGGDCENGGWVYKVLDFMTSSGVPAESCFPYKAKTNVDCGTACKGWEEDGFTIPGWGWITQGDPYQVENLKRALMYHPVSVSFTVYSDFNSYKSGVYEHVRGDVEGGHAVLLVGWDDELECWICKNSWGPAWGDDGYFRIKWGDSNLGAYTPFIYNDFLSNGEIFTSTGNLYFNAIYGDTDQQKFTIYNTSNQPLQYFIIEYEKSVIYDWLEIENSAGFLQPSESREIVLTAKTRELTPGEYPIRLGVTTNSSTPPVIVAANLNVIRPDYDCRIDSAIVPINGYSIFRDGVFTANISNTGKKALDNVKVECRLSWNGEQVFCDTTRSGYIASASAANVHFKSFMPTFAGEYEMQLSIVDFVEDYNDFNDVWKSPLFISNRFESYENDTDLWAFEGGWAAGDALNGHHGFSSAHCNGGVYPYPENMDAMLTMTSGLALQGIDSLYIGFWERHFLQDEGDYCVVETSSDSLNWDEYSIISGTEVSWKQHIIDATPYISEGAEYIWIRFHFVSNSDGGSIGVLIDDFEVFLKKPQEDNTYPQSSVSDARLPDDFILEQNYPNPFNPQTMINYSVPQAAHVKLYIINSGGQLVSELVNEFVQTGQHNAVWQANDYATGVYFYILDTVTMSGSRYTARKKMVLLR